MRKKLGWIAMLLAMCVMNGWACTNLTSSCIGAYRSQNSRATYTCGS